jgi:hypothetical protein
VDRVILSYADCKERLQSDSGKKSQKYMRARTTEECYGRRKSRGFDHGGMCVTHRKEARRLKHLD